METSRELGNVFDTDDIMKVLLKIAPPVMLTQLIRHFIILWTAFLWDSIRGTD